MKKLASADENTTARGLILGIESSCDETAAAVVAKGAQQLSSIVASQIAIHAPFGGVVPELASREHLRNIVPVVQAALDAADVTLAELAALAVTEGPGLAGALHVGITYAKSLAFALGKPLIAVNHLEGHIHAVLLEQARASAAALPLPTLALVVSGGHTHLYLAQRSEDAPWLYRNVGRTVDDAAGEAFDKVAKLLGLPYPGGPWMDKLASHGNPRAVPFSFARVKPRPGGTQAAMQPAEGAFLFSFSGIKTAVLRYVELHGMQKGIEARRTALDALASPQLNLASPQLNLASPQFNDALKLCDQQTLDLIASFQFAVVENLKRRTFDAAQHFGAASVLVSGGVAANRELRATFSAEAEARGLPVAFPSLALSTDNAAMIAAAAWPKYLAGAFAGANLSAQPSLRLEESLNVVDV